MKKLHIQVSTKVQVVSLRSTDIDGLLLKVGIPLIVGDELIAAV